MVPVIQVGLGCVVTFMYDYGAVTRWVLADGSDAATIEPRGWVVFSKFDSHPAYFAGVVWYEAPFDEVADGSGPADVAKLWRAAAERLRAARRPGATPHVKVRLGACGSARVLACPYQWLLDGERLSAPEIPGPDGTSVIEKRPGLEQTAQPYCIAMPLGVHRLEGSVQVIDPGAPARSSGFSIDIEVRADAVVSLELSRSPAEPAVRVVATKA